MRKARAIPLVALSLTLGFARSALADATSTLPIVPSPTPDAGVVAPTAVVGVPVVLFDAPRAWPGGLSETWRLRDRQGRVVCVLPCSSPVPQGSGYTLDGAATFEYQGGKVSESMKLAVPERIDASSGAQLRGRVRLQKGNPNGAIVLAVLSGISAVVGGALIIATMGSRGSCRGIAVDLCGFGAGFEGLGLLGEGGAILWGTGSERARVEVGPATPRGSHSHARSIPAFRVRLSPAGLVGVF